MKQWNHLVRKNILVSNINKNDKPVEYLKDLHEQQKKAITSAFENDTDQSKDNLKASYQIQLIAKNGGSNNVKVIKWGFEMLILIVMHQT